MAKKNKKVKQNVEEKVDGDIVESSLAKTQEEQKNEPKDEQVAKPKSDKKVDSKKDNKKSKQKVKKQSKTAKRIKETTSELKKVTWPTFGTVVKKTGVVLAVVIIFAVILFGIDRLLAWLFELLTTSMSGWKGEFYGKCWCW